MPDLAEALDLADLPLADLIRTLAGDSTLREVIEHLISRPDESVSRFQSAP